MRRIHIIQVHPWTHPPYAISIPIPITASKPPTHSILNSQFPIPNPTIKPLYSLEPPSLLAPSSKTYPTATGLAQLIHPAPTPVGALTRRSVKNTGCLTDESGIARSGAGMGTGNARGMTENGGMASSWLRGGVRERVCWLCGLRGLGGWVCGVIVSCLCEVGSWWEGRGACYSWS